MAGAAGAHVDAETWQRLALGELGVEERDAAIAHVKDCKACQGVMRGILASRGGSARRRQMSARRRAWIAATFGTLVAAGALSIWVATRPEAALAVVPVPEAATAGAAGAPGAGAATGRPAAFVWTEIPGADGYRVRIRDDAGRVVWTSGIATRPPVTFPVDLATRRGRHSWIVEALHGSSVVGRSAPVAYDAGP